MKKEQVDIEVLSQINNVKVGDLIKITPNDKKIFTRVVSHLEAMRDASDMLPEKKVVKHEEGCFCPYVDDKYLCEHNAEVHNQAIDACQVVVAKLLKENKELQQQLHEYKLAATAEADKVDELTKENKSLNRQLDDDEDGCVEDCVIVHSLKDRLNNWIHELAYYTEEDIATPKGTKKFIGKALDDKVKEIDNLREQLHNKILKEKLITGTGTSEQIFKREELDNGR